MAEINPLSNLSYTNKDFQSVYVELLDLAKKISYKWDPTVSNESDPGVLLLKLCAIIADKNNYNIDKNILECFPLSVSQESNARQLFEQLGYTMKWYRGATTQIAMRWIGEETEGTPAIYDLPQFTMVSDSANSIVYTIPHSISLSQDGTTVFADAIQGTAVEYSINGETKIVPSQLDSNNRLYFVDRNVAENGIFIQNADGSIGTYSAIEYFGGWKRVDNLAVEELGNTVYKFGVTQDGSTCYIEFPDDVADIMGAGINITYIKTDGIDGNISGRIIEKFYNDTSAVIENSQDEETVILSSDNVQITNPRNASNGSNPETIEDAYRGYRKTVGTFTTLVTLRDYTNAINNSGYISNGFVCDRTNDIQCSYKVMTYDGDMANRELYIEQNSGSPYIDAFALKIYALQYIANPSASTLDYNNTFNMLINDETETSPSIENAIGYIDDIKSIQHDFSPLLREHLCMIKNKYPIKCTIIPKYRVTSVQANAIRENVVKALYNALNAKEIDFGEEISYDFVYSTIMNADERIKAIALDDLVYHTYAVYIDADGEYQECLINPLMSADADATADVTRDAIQHDIYAKSVLNGNTQLLASANNVQYALTQKMVANVEDIHTVSTDTEIQMVLATNATESTYEVGENEHIYLYAPNLIDDVIYSSYVKIQYTLSTNTIIEADSDYSLLSGETITFYWKDSDADDDPYLYRCYGEGTIIHPTFKMSYEYNSNVVPVSVGGGRITSYADIQTLKFLTDSKYNLTANKKIAIRKINSTELSSGTKCYWILNNDTGSHMYTLFGADDTDYILQPNEYFMYGASDGSELMILGSGTKISRNTSGTEWYVKEIDYETIQEEGIGAFTADDWFTIPTNSTITITEMRSIMLSKGTTFKVSTLESPQSSVTITINNEGTTISDGSNLWDYSLSYIEDGQETIIPPVDIPDTGWNAMSYLSLNLSNAEPQELMLGQSITYETDDGTTGTINGTGTEAGEGVFLLSNVPFTSLGGKNINTIQVNNQLDWEFLNLYAYSSTIDGDDTNKTYSADGSIDIAITEQRPSVIIYGITFQLPIGEYILPVRITHLLDHLNLKFGEYDDNDPHDENDNYSDMLPINSNSPDINSLGTHYMHMNIVSDSQVYAIKIETGRLPSDTVPHIKLEPIYKYTTPNVGYEDDGTPIPMTASDFTDILNHLIALDMENKYDYTYKVKEDEYIENPLEAMSFLNSNHIYHNFTICQIETPQSKISVTNKVK